MHLPRIPKPRKTLECPHCHKTNIRPCNYLRHVDPCKRKHETQTLLVPLKEPED